MRRLLHLLSAVFLAGCVPIRPFADVRRELTEDRFIRVGDQLVHTEQAGDGAPLILLHGFGASTWSWRKVIPGLARSFRVVAIDLNGFGYTQRPKTRESYTRDGQARLVLDVLDALGIERAHFAGHSYGGALTLWIASRHPERVRSLVLVDSAAPTYPNDRRSGLAGLRPLSSFFLRTLALRPNAVRRSLERSFYDDSLVTPELVQGYFDRLRIQGVEDAYVGLTAPDPSPSSRETVAFEKIEAPVLMVWGAEDEVIRVEGGRRAAARFPNGGFVAIPEAGHIPMEEKPEEWLRAVLPFLESQGR